MNGNFRTDITRNTFHRHKNFSRVLMQQGRVQIDADWNEQTDILLYYMRTLASDIIGPHAGPEDNLGFAIHSATDQDAYTVAVKAGRYYVDGILCELNNDIKQYIIEDEEQEAAKPLGIPFQNRFLFYLDVWEREVTHQEDDGIREVALGGPDTATRAQVVCQVRTKALSSIAQLISDEYKVSERNLKDLISEDENNLKELLKNLQASEDFTRAWTKLVRNYAHMFPAETSALPADPREVGPAYLEARTLTSEDDQYTSPCTVPPSSQYRGVENQLYRVEVHTSGYGRPNPNHQQAHTPQSQAPQAKGDSKPPKSSTDGQYATFKWSRENGSVIFPITSPIDPSSTETLTVTVSGLGRDNSRFALDVDDWVEVVDYEDTLELEPGKLMRVTAIDYINMQVSLTASKNQQVSFDTDSNSNKPFLLRRWDYHSMDPSERGATTLAKDGALEIIENHWLTLEDGIQVQFHHGTNDPAPFYHTGDYWLIPARTATGDIEWPHHGNEHQALPPHGIKHYYAPLAYVIFDQDNKKVKNLISLQRSIKPMGA